MNWSGLALKGTIGASSMAVTGILADPLEPVIGLFGLMAVILVPLTILVFFRLGEVPLRILKIAHGAAALWFIGLVIASVGAMAVHGFLPEHALLGAFMALGLWPCADIARSMWAGHYDSEQA